MSNNDFFKLTIETLSITGSLVDMDELEEYDRNLIYDDLRKLTHDVLAAYGYQKAKEVNLEES